MLACQALREFSEGVVAAAVPDYDPFAFMAAVGSW